MVSGTAATTALLPTRPGTAPDHPADPAAESASASGEVRANRFIAILLALQRLSYLIPIALTTASTEYRNPALNVVLVVVTIAWNVALFVPVRRRWWFTERQAWIDVAWASLLIIVVSYNVPSDDHYDSLNWSSRMGQAAAALAGVAFERLAVAVAGLLVVLAAHTVATVTHAHGFGDGALTLATCLNGLIWFAVILRFALHYLRRQGRRLDELAAARVAADSRRAAEQARYSSRLAHHRALHDTVLTTLVALARGGLDHRSEEVRARCARDADYIRRLLRDDDRGADGGEPGEGDEAESAGSLPAKVSEVLADAEGLGLRVHYRLVDPPDEVPPPVVEALGEAAREALNNVLKHAGTGTAWLTVSAANGGSGVCVRIVDRGTGFDPSGPPDPSCFGMRRSITERMQAVGGEARVTAAPGEGACIDLVWPG